jgi:uncharacterized protein
MTEQPVIVNNLNWFEIPVLNFDRARAFYENLFDVDIKEEVNVGFRMGVFPHNGGGGAIIAGEGYEPSEKGAVVYLNGGNDLQERLRRVEHIGGEVLIPKTLISPEIGYFAFFRDSEGNRMALHSLH